MKRKKQLSPADISEMLTRDGTKFSELLEKNGFSGAIHFILEDLIPLARKNNLTLLETAQRYHELLTPINQKSFQIAVVLEKIPESELRFLEGINIRLGRQQ